MNGKYFARIFFISFVLLLTGAPLRAQTGTPAPPSEDSSVAPATAEPVPFTGGVMIGDVRMETGSDENPVFILNGATGFILPQDHAGGILTLSFLQTPEQAVQAEFRQFPHGLTPESLSLDGKPVEIQIAPGQVYQFMGIDPVREIVLEDIVFIQNAVLSNPDTCGCTRVQVTSENQINAADITALLHAE
jgi:hypothetical protein